MKKFLSLLLVFSLISATAIVHFSAFAQEETGVVGGEKYVYEPTTGIIVSPTVIQKIDSQEDFRSIYESEKPTQVAYFILDEQGENIVLKDGTRTLLNAFTNCDTKVIPMFEVSTQKAAESLVNFVKTNNASDIIVTSGSDDILNYIFNENVNKYMGIRTAYQIKSDDNINNVAYKTYGNKSTLAICYKTLSRSEMEYLQARFVSVWCFNNEVKNSAANDTDIDNSATRAALDNGANGVFVTDPQTTYSLYESVTNQNVRCRRVINIAHRGLNQKYPENTVEAMIGAYEAGADAVECDIFETAYHDIVVNHDPTRSGYDILNNTREYIKENLNLGTTEKPIRLAYLDEMFEVLQQEKYKDKVLVIEFKVNGGYENYIANSETIYNLAKQYNVENQITFICFNNDLLKTANDITNVPLANLTNHGTYQNILRVNSQSNSVCDAFGSGAFSKPLARRGMMTISWTSTMQSEIVNEVNSGVGANTTNLADIMNTLYSEDKNLTAELILAQNTETTTKHYEVPEDYDGPYVVSGFYANFDGKNHGNDSTTWQSTIGSSTANVGTPGNNDNLFTDEGYLNNSRQCYFSDDIVNLISSNEFTVEVNLGQFTSIGSNFNTILNSANDSFSLFRRVNNNVIELKSGYNGGNSPRPTVSNASTLLPNSTISVTAKVGGKARIYVNGELMAEQNYNSASNVGNFFFGHSENGKQFTALFKSIRFYNKQLTDDEVMQNAKVDNNSEEDTPTSPTTDPTQPSTDPTKPSVTQPTTGSESSSGHLYHKIYEAEANGTSMNGYLNCAKATVDTTTFDKTVLAVTKTTDWDELGFSLKGNFGNITDNPIGIRIWIAGNTNAINYNGISLGFGSGDDYKNRYATAERGKGNFKLTSEGAYYEYYWNTDNTVYKMYDASETRTFSTAISASAKDIFTTDFLKELNQIYFIMQDLTIKKDTTFYIKDVDFITDSPKLTLSTVGASIRLKSDTTGLRFATKVNINEVKALEEKGYNIEFGTLIAPLDKFEDSELTLDSPEENFINVKFNKEYIGEVVKDCIVGSIVNLHRKNISRNFLGRGYAKITKAGEKDVIVYANNYKSEPRSTAYVAYKFKNDESNRDLYIQYKDLVDDWAAFLKNDPNAKDTF